MKTFKSDNYSGIHPQILESIIKANTEHAMAYCEDELTKKCNQRFNEIFEQECKVVYVFNGTGANVLSIKSCLKSYQAIICADSAHINTNETGAPESITGVKIYSVPTNDGKITPLQIRKEYTKQNIFGKQRAMPKMVSISQCTEYGTVYTLQELQEIKKMCVELDLYLHIDCCRVFNACAYLNCNLADITSKIGADIISLGGTKLGCMIAESVVIFNPKLMIDVEYLQKNTLQLYSKNRFMACQYLALFQNNLWLEIANNQNKIAKTLEKELTKKGFEMVQKVESNHLFIKMPTELAQKLQESNWCYIWPDDNISQIRLVINFDNTQKDALELINFIKNNT